MRRPSRRRGAPSALAGLALVLSTGGTTPVLAGPKPPGPSTVARGVGRARGGRLAAIGTGLAVAATLVLPQTGARAASAAPRPAILNVTGWQIQSVPASQGPPTPNAADGIGPGSYLLIDRNDDNGQRATFVCTANFVWNGGATQYLGAAGHCFLTSKEDSLKNGNTVTSVRVCTANCFFGGQLGDVVRGTFANLGTVAYARQNDPNAPAPTDVGHDFGLVVIPSGLAGQVRPSEPVWGGPKSSASLSPGDPVCVYGNGIVVGETFATKARAGVGEVQKAGAWYAALPSAPGDSGSGVVNCATSAGIGLLTHIVIYGPGTNPGIAGTTVAQAISMASSDGGLSISLVNG